jgi:hypothetical protein
MISLTAPSALAALPAWFTTTAKPSRASRKAAARPMPHEALVTMTAFVGEPVIRNPFIVCGVVASVIGAFLSIKAPVTIPAERDVPDGDGGSIRTFSLRAWNYTREPQQRMCQNQSIDTCLKTYESGESEMLQLGFG